MWRKERVTFTSIYAIETTRVDVVDELSIVGQCIQPLPYEL